MMAEGSWCILRTQGRHTLRLAASLAEDGFDVWTPQETKTIRVPRKTVKRKVTLPIMPSYVFARAHHLIDLLELAAMPVKRRLAVPTEDKPIMPAHVGFSVMHYGESLPLIADRQLQALRGIEAKRAPRKKADRVFGSGVEVHVKIEGGSFAGMKGIVERSDEHHTLVCFDDRMTVRISTCLLDENGVRAELSLNEDAARKAA